MFLLAAWKDGTMRSGILPEDFPCECGMEVCEISTSKTREALPGHVATVVWIREDHQGMLRL